MKSSRGLFHSILLVALVAWLPAVSTERQAIPVIELLPASDRAQEAFSRLTAMTELPDSRILVIDPRERRLGVLDFRADSYRDLGRHGSGPGEYRDATRLLRVRRDTTLLGDVTLKRWLLITDDSIVATLSPDTPAIEQTFVGVPDGGDTLGRILTHTPSKGDSASLALVERSTGKVEVVTMLRVSGFQPSPAARAISDGAMRGMAFSPSPVTIREQAVLFPDGWIAVVRLVPYRVEWRNATGNWIRGRGLPYEQVPFGSGERAAYSRARDCCRGAENWPAVLPPFQFGEVIQTPFGWLLVGRFTQASQRRMLYDMIDRTGRLRARLSVPDGMKILGTSANWTYVVVSDTDGVQRVQRHPPILDQLRALQLVPR